MHFLLYSWSELVELDKHVEHLELAIASIDQLAKSLYKTDNKHLYDSTLISIRNELKQQLEDILKQFTDSP